MKACRYSRNITFDAPAGTTTALVGTSGSGKSTLVSLVDGVQPSRQRPHPDRRPRPRDLPPARVPPHARRRAAGQLPLRRHHPRQHRASPSPDATEEEVREAARIAHCDEFALRFELGYGTIVGERGVKLTRRPAPARRDRARDPRRPARS
ncbi:MAG: ATP-binding cassette domain-containing protein [Gemmatimonadales bacterium]